MEKLRQILDDWYEYGDKPDGLCADDMMLIEKFFVSARREESVIYWTAKESVAKLLSACGFGCLRHTYRNGKCWSINVCEVQ